MPRHVVRRVGAHRSRVTISAGISVVLALVAASCGQSAEESSAERGSGLYRANCAACHGDALEGSSLGPSLLDGAPAAVSDAAMADAIRNGVEDSGGEYDGMPGNGALLAGQIEEIVAYVRSQQRAASSTPGD